MSDRNVATLAAMLCAVGTLATACSDTPRDPVGDGGGADAIVDAKADSSVPDGSLPDKVTPDGSQPDKVTPVDVIEDNVLQDIPIRDAIPCPAEPVWNANSARLVFRSVGGFISRPNDVGCPGSMLYEFSPGDQTLSLDGCLSSQRVHRVAHLSQSATSRLTTQIAALRTTCAKGCGADAPTMSLTIEDAAGCAAQVYESNFYAGCTGTQSPNSLPPYIEFGELSRLGNVLTETMSAICAPDAGESDAGTCEIADGGATGICSATTPLRIEQADAQDPPGDALLPDVVMDAQDPPGDALLPDVVMDAQDPPGDALPDAADGDAATCSVQPVWSNASSFFTLVRAGGLPPPSGGDAGCTTQAVSFLFSLPTQSLVQVGCIGGRYGRRQIELTDEQISSIVTSLKALQTTCEKSCGADFPSITLSVRDCAERTEGNFNSNFYAGCASTMIAPPYIAFERLGTLAGQLESAIRTSCDGVDAGSAGVCRPFCRQEFR